MPTRTAVLALVCCLAPSLAEAQSPLSTAQSVRNLTPEQAAEARPVKLAGVVTHVNPHVGDFFVQDATAGIYVHPTPPGKALKVGEQVEVEGVTDAGDFSPCVTATGVKVVGPGRLPDPLPFNLSREDSRWLDGQWVMVWVVVKGVSAGNGYTRIEVENANGSAVVAIPGEAVADSLRRLPGTSLTVRGVCVARFKDRVVVGPPIVFTRAVPLIPLTPRDRPTDTAPRLIDHLLRFAPSPHLGVRRVQVTGVVTAAPLPGLFFLQDESGGATVIPETATMPPANTRVEATGFLHIDGRRIRLIRAEWKTLGPAEPPAPLAVGAAELADGRHDARLVRVEGKVAEVHGAGGWAAVTLTEGAARFDVFLAGAAHDHGFDGLRPGSRVAAVGVATGQFPTGPAPGGVAVALRDPADLTVLAAAPLPPEPSWWTGERTAAVFGGLGLVCLVVAAWGVALRVQVVRAAREIRRQFEEKARLEAQLKEAAKLEAVGRLAGGIAHDFNNLLTVITGCAELLGPELAGGRGRELVADIHRAGERAAALTGQLLTFSRRKDVPVSAVVLNDVVRDTAQLLARVIGEDIRVETRLAADLPAVRGEPGLLHQVLMNLAVNARDAMPGGGTVTFETARVTHDDTAFVRLAVSDTGTGMDAATQARVFEPFFTTKEVGKGTGLGLATVYGIVKTLKGKIAFASSPGEGTTFHIDLRVYGDAVPDSNPPAVRPPTPPDGPAPDWPPGRLHGVVVLLVEDNDMVRDLLVQGLAAEGATVLEAHRGEEALRASGGYDGRIDVVVTDVVMPGMGGRELAEAIRAARPGARVVFMSGYTSDEVLRRGVLDDEVAFLQKPFTPDQLADKLLHVLADGRATARGR